MDEVISKLRNALKDAVDLAYVQNGRYVSVDREDLRALLNALDRIKDQSHDD